MKKVGSIISLILVLTSCATGYHPNGLGGGFSEFKVSNDTYIVRFRGNGYTSSDRAFQYALRRSADLAKEKGYKYFKVIQSSTNVSRSTFTTPLRANTQSNYNSSANGYFGNNSFNAYGSTRGNSTTTISGGDVINIDKPLTQVAIKLYKNQVNGALDADVILSNFAKR